jgi:hypothetical protein
MVLVGGPVSIVLVYTLVTMGSLMSKTMLAWLVMAVPPARLLLDQVGDKTFTVVQIFVVDGQEAGKGIEQATGLFQLQGGERPGNETGFPVQAGLDFDQQR